MIVCICNNVSEDEIVETINKTGATTIKELQEQMSICNRCTGCTYVLLHLLQGKTLDKLFG